VMTKRPEGRGARPKAKKRLGQHFLEPAWADKLVQAVAPRAGDRFVEIGPGRGALTLRLAPAVAHVTAVEVDRDMSTALIPHAPPNVSVIEQDFLAFDLAGAAGGGVRIVGNLPYNLSTPILFKILQARRDGAAVIDATLMLQREVAERIEAPPGTKDYGTLSVFVQLRATVTRLLSLPPGAFRPMPKVHSAVIRLEFRAPSVVLSDEATFERLVRTVFTRRRKTIVNALKPFADARGVDARAAAAAAGIDGRRRPETLQLAEFARLADVFVTPSAAAVL
jgi:16S rRNA (adenine1518-N6/adenine1519-N6)-dimethyltransferase